MTILYKNEQSGRSMVEMLGVLAIIGVLSIGGISGYSKAMSKYRVNKTLDQISMLVMNIRTLYSSAVNYAGLSNKVAVQMGIIPRDMLQSSIASAGAGSGATTIVNAYSGRVEVAVDTGGGTGGDSRQFTVSYSGLPLEACVAIATADWGSQAGSGLQSIAVSPSKEDKDIGDKGGTPHTIDSLPLSLSAAAAECTAKDSGSTITWTYY